MTQIQHLWAPKATQRAPFCGPWCPKVCSRGHLDAPGMYFGGSWASELPAGASFGVSGFFVLSWRFVLKLALNTDVVIALTPPARLHAVARLLPPARSHSFVRLLLWLATASCCRPQLVSFNTRRSTSHTACTASRLHVLSRPTPSLSVSFLLR